jgi:NADH:ubiquinone oxidoreductase subunit E
LLARDEDRADLTISNKFDEVTMKQMIIGVLAAACLAGCAAAPQQSAAVSAEPAASTDNTADGAEVAAVPAGYHCYYEAPTGSRFKRKICTDAEESRNGQALVRDIQNKGTLINRQ